MNKIRKWFHRPKKSDNQLLSQFYYADEELSKVAAKLESLDEQNDTQHCTLLASHLRSCQDSVLSILNQMMIVCIPADRANRDFWVKFPEEVRHDSLGGQLWFGAECLAAGSIILNQEAESVAMCPLARQLTSCMEEVRSLARQQALRDVTVYPEDLCQALRGFDGLMAEFELRYVSAMVPVKSVREYDIQQDITVLFCETATRALNHGYISQAMLDEYEPALMITIPRLAIVCGLLVYPDGPLQLEGPEEEMSELFRPFHSLLRRIRDLLRTLKEEELQALERKLCDTKEEELLAIRRRSSAVPLTMTSNLQMSSSPLASSSSTLYHSPSSLHSPPSHTFCPTPSVFSVSPPNTPRPSSRFPTSTSAIKNSSLHDTTPLPGSTPALSKTSSPTPISKSETPFSSFALSQAQLQQQRDGIQTQMEMPPYGQTQGWSGGEGLETGDRDEGPSFPPFLQAAPNHVHPHVEISQLLSSSVQSNSTTHSGPNLVSDCTLSCSMQSDVTEMEQLSRMFHLVEDEMTSFLWPPSQNPSPVPQRRRETHSHSANQSPLMLRGGGIKINRAHYSSSPSLSQTVSPNLSHKNRSNHSQTLSPLTRDCSVSPRSSNGSSPALSPLLSSSPKCTLSPNESQWESPKTRKAPSFSFSSSLSSLDPSSSVGGNLLEPGCSEERVFSMEDFDTNTNSPPSSPLLGLKQGLKQETSLPHETYLEAREDAPFTSSPLSEVKEGLRDDPSLLPFPLLRVKQGGRCNTSLPSSPHLGMRHHSSLPCSPLLRVRRGASSCPTSPRISLSRRCIEAALERSKNSRNRGNQPETPDFCSRRKPVTFDPVCASVQTIHLNGEKVRGEEDKGEKVKGQKKEEEEEEDERKREEDEEKSEEEEEEEDKEEEEGAGVAEVIAMRVSRIRVSATVTFNPTSSHDSLSSKTEREEVGEGEEDGIALVWEEEDDDLKRHRVELQQPRCPSAPPFEPDLDENQRLGVFHTVSPRHEAQERVEGFQSLVGSLSGSSRHPGVQREEGGDGFGLPRYGAPQVGDTSAAMEERGPAFRIYPSLTRWNTSGYEKTEMREEEKREKRLTSKKNTSGTTIEDSDIQLPQNSIRSRFHGSYDLLHRLFVCISGVADQLQTNYASDLRAILKTLFDTMTTKTVLDVEYKQRKASLGLCDWTLEDCFLCRELLNSSSPPSEEHGQCKSLPFWVPDESCSFCSACSASFSVIRRKHHCRSCGKIFCSRCSPHSAPLPRYSQLKPVRVCTHCYLFHVTPFCRVHTT